jgi:hypothetical protein
MIGPKKLGEIKPELRQHLGKRPKDLGAWLDRQIAKLQPKSVRHPRVAEDLLWVRKMLRAAEKKPRAGKSRKTRTGKTPAA